VLHYTRLESLLDPFVFYKEISVVNVAPDEDEFKSRGAGEA
jgi:hypothetical protein